MISQRSLKKETFLSGASFGIRPVFCETSHLGTYIPPKMRLAQQILLLWRLQLSVERLGRWYQHRTIVICMCTDAHTDGERCREWTQFNYSVLFYY